jgi:hypothetical protein
MTKFIQELINSDEYELINIDNIEDLRFYIISIISEINKTSFSDEQIVDGIINCPQYIKYLKEVRFISQFNKYTFRLHTKGGYFSLRVLSNPIFKNDFSVRENYLVKKGLRGHVIKRTE